MMKTQYQYLIWTALLLMLIGCREKNQTLESVSATSTSVSVATPSIFTPPTTSASDLPVLLEHLPPLISDNLFLLGKRLSPNGEWLIRDDFVSRTIKITSTRNPDVYFEGKFGDSIASFSSFEWSPDSASVLVLAQTQVGMLSTDLLFIYKIVDGSSLEKLEYRLEYPSNWDVLWSPDSSAILIRSYEQNRMIFINKNGELLKTFELDQRGETRISRIWWVRSGIYFTTKGTRYDDGNLTIWPDQLVKLDPSTIGVESLPIRTGAPVAFSSEADKVMTIIETDDANILFIWNLITFQLEKTIVLPDEIFGEVSSGLDARVASMIIGRHDAQLYLYDWDYQTFKNYGAAKVTFGWRSALRGVLVITEVSEAGKTNYKIELVKP